MSILANASITPFNLRAGGLLLLTTLGLASLWLLSSSSRSSGAQTTPFRPGSIIHVVLFSYTPSTSDSEKSDIADAFMGLKDRCTRDGKSYILDIEGGSNGSPEEAGQEYEHAYVVTFASSSDRDYYVHHDPVHAAFKSSLAGRVHGVSVADFEAGHFKGLSHLLGSERGQKKHGRRRSGEVHVRMI